MHGFEWKNQRGIEGTGFVRALRTLLTSQLPALTPALMNAVSDTLDREFERQKIIAGTIVVLLYELLDLCMSCSNVF